MRKSEDQEGSLSEEVKATVSQPQATTSLGSCDCVCGALKTPAGYHNQLGTVASCVTQNPSGLAASLRVSQPVLPSSALSWKPGWHRLTCLLAYTSSWVYSKGNPSNSRRESGWEARAPLPTSASSQHPPGNTTPRSCFSFLLFPPSGLKCGFPSLSGRVP